MSRYWIDGEDTFGTRLSCIEDCGPNDVASTDMETDNPKKAIELWFSIGQKFPMCTNIRAKTKADAIALLREATPEYLTELHDKYKCPYKLEFLINSVSHSLSGNCYDFYENEYGDSVSPFCCG